MNDASISKGGLKGVGKHHLSQISSAAEIRLLGQRIAIRCSEDEDPEIVDETVQLVSTLLRNAEIRSKGVAAHQVAVLALLDLAGEYVKAKHRTVNYKKMLEDKTRQLFHLLDEANPSQ